MHTTDDLTIEAIDMLAEAGFMPIDMAPELGDHLSAWFNRFDAYRMKGDEVMAAMIDAEDERVSVYWLTANGVEIGSWQFTINHYGRRALVAIAGA